MNDKIAYTDKMLATIFRMKESTVKLALDTFEQFEMIQKIDGAITIPKWNKHQTLDAYEKKKARDRRYQEERRARQRALIKKSSDKSFEESSDVAVSEEERDIDNNICSPEPDERESNFEKIYAIYPKKRGRTKAFANYCSWLKGRSVNGKRRKLTNREMYLAVHAYVEQQKEHETELEYYKNFDTLMGSQLLDYVEVEQNE